MPRKPRKFFRRIKSRLERELKKPVGVEGRLRLYKQAGLFRSKRLRALVYSVERNGAGPHLCAIIKSRKAIMEMKRLVSVKNSGRAFIGALKLAGGDQVGLVLMKGVGRKLGMLMQSVTPADLSGAILWGKPGNFGELLQRTSTSTIAISQLSQAILGARGAGFGQALDMAGAEKMSIALEKHGGKKLGQDLKRNFVETVDMIKKMQY